MKTIITILSTLFLSTATAQNTGIGTTAPTEPLQVNGNIKIGKQPWTPGKTYLLKFGDSNYVHIGEVGNDSLERKALNFNFRTPYGIKTNIDLFGSMHINGSLHILNGSQAAGKILISDSAGTVTWGYPPSFNSGFFAIKTNVQIISQGSYKQVEFDAELYDDEFAFSDNTFTSFRDGVYHFDIKLLYNLDGVPARYTQLLGFFVDGEEISRTQQLVEPGLNFNNSIELSLDYKLFKGQSVTVQTFQNSGINQVIIPTFTFFSGHRIY